MRMRAIAGNLKDVDQRLLRDPNLKTSHSQLPRPGRPHFDLFGLKIGRCVETLGDIEGSNGRECRIW
jgi:hypothetical protein